MRKLEIADYEPASDIGHMRFYPKGDLIKDLLSDWAYYIAVERLGALKIETPILYRWSEPDIREQGESFHERHYVIKSNNTEFVLRFAGDFGLFRMMKTATITYKQLPVRIYEYSPSYRRERSGELVGLKRLRSFTMPDIHSFCKDIEDAMNEYENLFRHYTELANGIGIEYAVAFRVVDDFYYENKKWFVKLLKIVNKPALIEVLSGMKHYWLVKHEYQGIDSVGGNCQLCTVQLDISDGKRYGLNYINKDGEKSPMVIVHSSVGSIERWMYILLEDALKKEKPSFPLWISPIQARIIPVSQEYLDYCFEIMKKMESIRVDIDDRDETLSKKIRSAEREWIPYIVVVGEKEKEGGFLSVRVRENKIVKKMNIEDLKKEIEEKVGDMPKRKLSLPERLSMRPIFV